MTLGEGSKPISKSDDAAKDFIRQSLGQDFTRGFDIDSIYCEVNEGSIRWTLFEFLKCESVTPQESHPKRYWNGRAANKRKFLSLWTLRQSLIKANVESRLLLVNYRSSELPVKLMEVVDITEEAIKTKDQVMTFQAWSTWFRDFNKNKLGSTWEALKLL